MTDKKNTTRKRGYPTDIKHDGTHNNCRISHQMTPVGLQCLLTSSAESNLIPSILMTMETPIRKKELALLLEERLLPRFHRLTEIAEPPNFVTDTNFNVMNHINVVELPFLKNNSTANSTDILMAAVDKANSRLLNPIRPLWEYIIFQGKGNFGDGAVLFRVHHSIADGISMGYASYILFDEGFAELSKTSTKRTFDFQEMMRILGLIIMVALHFLRILLLFPILAPMVTWKHFKVWMNAEPPNPFNSFPLTGLKRSAFVDLQVSQVHALADRLNVTINDVVLCAISGALRRSIARKNNNNFDIVPNELHCGIPVNIRLTPVVHDLHNRLGAILVLLPMKPASTLNRMAIINSNTKFDKMGPEAHMAYMTAYLFSFLPVKYMSWAVSEFSKGASVVLSNICFMKRSCSFNGHRVLRLVPLVAPSPGVSTGFACISYSDFLTITVSVDICVDIEPKLLISDVMNDFHSLCIEAGMST